MRRTTLGFVPLSIGSRLVGGAMLGIGWTICCAFPVVHALESDVPDTTMIGLMCLVAITPALLAGRRHSLAATLAWDDRAITHFLGGRVKTAIAWKDATIRTHAGRFLQIADAEGRCISLAVGHGLTPAWLYGRRMIAQEEAEELTAIATRLGCPQVAGLVREGNEGPPIFRDPWRLVPLTLAGWWFVSTYPSATVATFSMMLVCFALLVSPMRRLARAVSRRRTSEWIAFDGEELGLVRARRLDGGRVLVDLAPAQHPDALVATRRGFVAATLKESVERPSMPYRAGERVLEAVDLETQADRVLRFERLRTAFVDLFAYGGLFAMSVAAVLVS